MDENNYLLALYDEADYEQIDDIFLELYKRGIPVKSVKDNYTGGLESLVSDATAVLFVISPASFDSRTINYHIQLAEQHNKHIIPYFLCEPDEVNISKSLYLKMDGSATIPACDYADNNALVARALSELKPYFPEVFEPKKKKKKSPIPAFFVAAALCFAAILMYLLWLKPANTEKMLTYVRQSTAIIYAVEDSMASYSTGSGFFIDEKGTLATNYHVVDEGAYFLVKPFGSEDFHSASVVSVDEVNDLATLRVSDTFLVTDYLTLSDKKVSVGDAVYVSGYPKGIDLTISNGIISNDEHYSQGTNTEYYMLTAAVSPGSSGGPVVDESGKVIGIATAKYTEAENVNLARPVKYLKELLKKN